VQLLLLPFQFACNGFVLLQEHLATTQRGAALPRSSATLRDACDACQRDHFRCHCPAGRAIDHPIVPDLEQTDVQRSGW
jgi:hypothetical protein